MRHLRILILATLLAIAAGCATPSDTAVPATLDLSPLEYSD